MNETANETVIEDLIEPVDPVVEDTAEPVAVAYGDGGRAPQGPRYELALILRPTLDDEAKNAQIEQVTQLLGRFGATIEKIDEWGRRRLAYEIAKQNEGFYYFITFSCDAHVPAEIESRVRIMEGLLRYLIIRIEE